MDVRKAAKLSLPLCVVILCFGFYGMAVHKRGIKLEQPSIKPGTYNKGKFPSTHTRRIVPQKLAEARAGQLKRKFQNWKPLLVNQTRKPEVRPVSMIRRPENATTPQSLGQIHEPENTKRLQHSQKLEGGRPENVNEKPKVQTRPPLRINQTRISRPNSGKLMRFNRTQRPDVTTSSPKRPIKTKIAKSTPNPNIKLFQQATDVRERCNAFKSDGLYQEPTLTKRWKNDRWNIFVLDKYKVLFCVVPRGASTSIRRLLLTLEGHTEEASDLDVGHIHTAGHMYLKTFRDYSVAEAQQRIKQYTKVLVVREPMERLLSAYRAQFEGATLENVNKFYDLHLDKVPNFPEFVTYLLNRIKVGTGEYHQLDAHWCTLEYLSQPCTIQYDMVVRFETLEEDLSLLFRQLHWENVLTFSTRHASGYANSKTNNILVKYYREIPKFQREKLKEFYSTDYHLFGYTYPQVLSQL